MSEFNKVYKVKRLSKFRQIILLISFMVIISSCTSDEFQRVELQQFVGTWELKGRSMFEGVQIEIKNTDKNKLQGTLVKLNDNKFVKLFAEPNEAWVTGIKRTSNFEFNLTEKKLGSPLFSLYDLETSKSFKAQFIDENTIGLSAGNAKPSNSSIRYVRVKADNYGNKTN